MNIYHMWFNLIDSHKDVEFSRNVASYLNHLKDQGKIESWRLTRRKFGFGPDHLGEFHCEVHCKDLTQLDTAFSLVAPVTVSREAPTPGTPLLRVATRPW